jgi:phosphoesterase RecJ-like protein
LITVKDFAEKLKKFNSFAIICHIRPDGDSVGSSLALKDGLILLGKKADVYCADVIPDKFSFIGGVDGFSTKIKGEYDAFVSVDCAEEGRLGDLYFDFIKCKNTFSIDHHISNTLYAKINYVFDNSSNCENIYDVLKALGVDINSSIANKLLLGISTDTGNFGQKNVTPKAFLVASDLMAKGGDINKIDYEMFKRQSKGRAKLLGTVMSKIRYALDDKLAIAIINKDTIDQCGATPDETEGFINFVLSIDCVEVAASIMEVGDKKYKISLRSKHTNVNEIASTFGGGGHILASGCMISGYLEDVVDRLTYTVSQYME